MTDWCELGGRKGIKLDGGCFIFAYNPHNHNCESECRRTTGLKHAGNINASDVLKTIIASMSPEKQMLLTEERKQLFKRKFEKRCVCTEL